VSISSSSSRLIEYLKRHGARATLRRAMLAGKRAVFAGRMAVFYCDLDDRKLRQVNLPAGMKLKRVTAPAQLSPRHLQDMVDVWNPKLANQDIQERFEHGASLWLVESEGQLAGYGWTIQGKTIAPYYFPLGPGDVQLFDFFVFTKFRGRALHWLLTGHILHTLAVEGSARAFADTGEWNQAQLASFKMTPLRFLGLARTFNVFGHQFTYWDTNEPAAWKQRSTARAERAAKVLRSNE
jgi:hypothetical protein